QPRLMPRQPEPLFGTFSRVRTLPQYTQISSDVVAMPVPKALFFSPPRNAETAAGSVRYNELYTECSDAPDTVAGRECRRLYWPNKSHMHAATCEDARGRRIPRHARPWQ